jgi:DNA (cytosine-5)-methyltransferase 1
MFFQVARVIEAKRPALLLLENVRGLLSAQEGYCFFRIIQTLDELGYDVEWQVLNSKHFGVPQNRQRVFIIGHLRDAGGREIFPITESGGRVD